MFEPLLQVPLSDAWVNDIVVPPAAAAHRLRVVIVTEIYETPGQGLQRLADSNTVAIVEALLQSDKVGFIAVGDHDREIYRDPWADPRAAAVQAGADLAAGRIYSFDYIARALLSPSVPLFGLADRHTRGAETAREQRLEALRGIHRSAPEPVPGLLSGILAQLRQAGFQEPLVPPSQLADWPALRRLFLDLLALPADVVRQSVQQLMEQSPSAWLDEERGTVSLLAEVLSCRLAGMSPSALRRLRDGLLDHLGLLLLKEPLGRAPIPLLQRFSQRLEVLKRGCPKALHQIEERSRTVQRVQELFALGRELRLNLSGYVHLSRFPKEELDPQRLRQERNWLARSLLSLLVAGESHGTRPLLGLLEKAVREGDGNVLGSPRPLHACVNRELARLCELEALDVEAGLRYKPRTQKHLLNLASLLGLEDGKYRAWRNHLRSYEALGWARPILRELDTLEQAIFRALAEAAPAAGRIFEMSRRLQTLEALCREELDLEKANRVLARPPEARELVRFLEDHGGRPQASDRQEAERLDDQCLPPASSFYEHCSELVEVFRRKILARMSERKADTAILLCGGFYIHAVAQALAREEVLCSIVTPRMVPEDETAAPAGRKAPDDPNALREKAQSFLQSVTYHFPGLQQQLGSNGQNGLDLFPGRADSQEWTALQARRVAWEEWLAGVSGEALQECRTCKRQARLEERPVVCRRGHVPDLVLPCRECPPEAGRFLCAQCAGREPIPFLRGHARSEAPDAETVEILVCNVHGIPLGEEDKRPRWLSGSLPGHSLFV